MVCGKTVAGKRAMSSRAGECRGGDPTARCYVHYPAGTAAVSWTLDGLTANTWKIGAFSDALLLSVVVACFALGWVSRPQIPAVAISVRDLAVAMSKKATEVVKMLRQMGETGVSLKFMVEPDAAELVALEFGLRTKRLKPRDR